MWQQATAPGTYNWEEALTYCENLTLPAGGYSDWRLPNRNELQSIVDYSRFNPAIDTNFFSDTAAAYFLSSTSSPAAWSVAFNNGTVYYWHKGSRGYVRAVRQWGQSPTVIKLSSFTAAPIAGQVLLNWSTETETDNAGLNIYRAESENGEYIKINDSLIPAQGSPTQGASYEFVDNDVQNRKTYYYKLEDIDLNGISTMHGPVSATPRMIYGVNK
jgi:hypothetical protein